MNRYKVWEISNIVRGDEAINEIASVINFIVQGKLY